MHDLDPLTRFSKRAEDYQSFRPPYPANLLQLLRDRCGLTPAWLVADLGAGSGRLTKVFLDNGNRVTALEPNHAMRAVAETELASHPRATILDAVAERTGLGDESVDLIVAGSAFHWFDEAAALREAMRILLPDGWMAIVRLTRRVATPFERAYETLLSRYSPDHRPFREYRVELEKKLVRCGFSRWKSVGEHSTTLDDLLGLSASYSIAPERNHSSFREFELGLRDLFDEFGEGGRAILGHDLRVQYCQLRSRHGGIRHEALEPSYWQSQDKPSAK